jgi:two-component system, LytTR family, sensor kinase
MDWTQYLMCTDITKRPGLTDAPVGRPKLKPLRWELLLLVWPAITLILATHTHFYQAALHLTFPDIPTSWTDSFRFPIVECLFWAVVTPAILWLSARCPLFSTRWARSIGLLIVANAAIEVLHALYRAPLTSLVYPKMVAISFRGLLRLYLTGNALNDVWVFWTIVMIEQFAGSYMRHAEQQRELAAAQLRALTAQLQPHFLFNVLNSVSALMRHDAEAADEMIGRLSDLIRTTLKDAPIEVPLRQELALVTNYIEIERMRFLDRLEFAVQVADEALDAAVPPLLLLPIVENAVRYAITPRTSPGRIDVEAVREKGMLAVRIKDDGPGQQNGSRLEEGIGLSNTRMRLQKHYSGAASFSYRNMTPSGFQVEFRLPYRSAAVEVRN